jgi:hypothetical protein
MGANLHLHGCGGLTPGGPPTEAVSWVIWRPFKEVLSKGDIKVNLHVHGGPTLWRSSMEAVNWVTWRLTSMAVKD